jgi:hypothetical protein
VVLEKNGDQFTERVRNEEVLHGLKRGQEYPTNNKMKEGELDWSHLA